MAMHAAQFFVSFLGLWHLCHSVPRQGWYSPEGPGEGCYSVCLSKEIEKLHSGIDQILRKESHGCGSDDTKKILEKAKTNSKKLDEVLKVISDLPIGSTEDKEKIVNLEKRLNESITVREALQRENKELGQEITDATKQLASLDQANQNLTRELAQLERICNDTISKYKENIKILKNKTEIVTEKKETLEKENEKLQEKIAQMTTEKNELKKSIDEAKLSVRQLQQESEDAKKKLNEAVQEITNVKNENEIVRIANEILEGKIVKSENELKIREKEQETLRKQTEHLQNLLNELETDLQTAEKQLKQTTEAKISLENENDQLKTKIDEALQKAAADKENEEKLGNENEKLRDELNELKKQQKNLDHKFSRLKDDVGIMETEARMKRLSYDGASYGATTSFIPTLGPSKAFLGERDAEWRTAYFDEDSFVPQRIWIKLPKPQKVLRFSLRYESHYKFNYQFVASNDVNCGDNSYWDVLHRGTIGGSHDSYKVLKSIPVRPRKDYRCYGFYFTKEKYRSPGVIMIMLSDIKLWRYWS